MNKEACELLRCLVEIMTAIDYSDESDVSIDFGASLGESFLASILAMGVSSKSSIITTLNNFLSEDSLPAMQREYIEILISDLKENDQ